MSSLNSNKLILAHEIITSTSNANNLSNQVKNAYKINRLILDVLSRVLQKWLEDFIIENKLAESINGYFNQLIENINNNRDIKKNERQIFDIKKTLENVKKLNNDDKYPNDFSQFDLTFCFSIFKNIFNIEPKHGWIEKYEDINIKKEFNNADAFNYSRLIRNKFYGHPVKFEIETDEFDVLIDQINKIFNKLNIKKFDSLIVLKDEILKNDLTKEITINDFERWKQETIKLTKEMNDVKFKSVKSIVTSNLTIKTNNIQLESLYIKQSFDENNKNYLTFKINEFLKSVSSIEKFLNSHYGKDYKIIIIECFYDKKNNKELRDLILNLSNDSIIRKQSIIIIGIEESIDESFKTIKLDPFNLNNFDFDTKINLLENLIEFQGKSISIKDLTEIQDINYISNEQNEIFNLIDSKILEKLISNQKIDLFYQQENDFSETESYYISRVFKRSIELKNEILKDEDFLFKNRIVFSEEDFNKTYQDRKNIHFLYKDGSNKNLQWKKTNGKISELRKYLTNDFVSFEGEEEFLNQPDKLMIICDEPGMGKSTILSSFSKIEIKKQVWFIKILLNKQKTKLRELRKNNVFNEKKQAEFKAFEFVIKDLLKLKLDQVESVFLKNLVNTNKLILMFDGFDEVYYKDEFLKLIDSLKNLNLNKIIITSREHEKTDLEDRFQTFSYKMKKFDQENQINFLKNYWKHFWNENNKQNEFDDLKLASIARKIIENFNKMPFTNKIDELIGIPLQTKMIAEIYQNDLKRDLILFKNLADLYKQFIEKKFEIKFVEKYDSNGDEDEERDNFYDHHIKYSFELIFDQEIINESNENNEKDDKVLKKIKEYGLIVDFVEEENNPKFLHQSYAEYFIAKSVCLNEYNVRYKKEIVKLFENRKYFLIRIFVNQILENKNENEQMSVFFDKEIIIKQVIEKCYIENLQFILKNMIEAGVKFDDITFEGGRKSLELAYSFGNKEIVKLLIEKGIDIKKKDSRGNNALHLASLHGHKEMVEFLINSDIDLNEKDNDGLNALELASISGHDEIVELLRPKIPNYNDYSNLRVPKEFIEAMHALSRKAYYH